MKTVLIPRYVHYYSMNEEYCVMLNALTLDMLYYKKELIKRDGDKISIDTSIENILINKGMIVKSHIEEEDIIEKNIQKYEKVKKQEIVKFLYIVPTVQCNLNCTYCHIQHGKENRKNISMKESTLVKGLEIFKRYGGFDEKNSEIMFYGGEPFLEAKFLLKSLEMIRSYSKTIKITIFTNGTLITEEIAEKLKEYNLYVIVSIDGRENIHNLARKYKNGHVSFRETTYGYRNLQENKIDVGISLVAGTHNVNKLEDEVLYLTEEFKPLDIGISTLHLFRDGKNPNEIDIKQLTQKLQSVQISMRKKGVYVEHLFRKVRPFVEQKVRIYDCPSCNSKLLITPWNTIGFCEAFMEEEQYFYNIENFELNKCFGREDWLSRVPLLKRECYTCPAISICGGGCPYDAYCESGSVCNKDTRRCTQSREMIEWLCRDLFEILKSEERIKNQKVYTPSLDERKMLYGTVMLDDSIPLQNYSKSNEEVD